MSRRAKIVCTLGPATSGPDRIGALVAAGLDVARLNMSHGDRDWHRAAYEAVRAAGGANGRSVGVLVDLQGPKIRLGRFASGPVTLQAGQDFTITGEDVPGDQGEVSVSYPGLAGDVRPGTRLLVDDGRVVLEVTGVQGARVRTRVLTGGPVSDHKGLNLPGVKVSVPALTGKDADDLRWALGLRADLVALSFVQGPEDAGPARAIMDEVGRPPAAHREDRETPGGGDARGDRRRVRRDHGGPRRPGRGVPAGAGAAGAEARDQAGRGRRPSRSSWPPRCSSR